MEWKTRASHCGVIIFSLLVLYLAVSLYDSFLSSSESSSISTIISMENPMRRSMVETNHGWILQKPESHSDFLNNINSRIDQSEAARISLQGLDFSQFKQSQGLDFGNDALEPNGPVSQDEISQDQDEIRLEQVNENQFKLDNVTSNSFEKSDKRNHATGGKRLRNAFKAIMYWRRLSEGMGAIKPKKIQWNQSIGYSVLRDFRKVVDVNEVLFCDRSDVDSSVCIARGDVRINATSPSFVLYAQNPQNFGRIEAIRPYPRLDPQTARYLVEEVKIIAVNASDGIDTIRFNGPKPLANSILPIDVASNANDSIMHNVSNITPPKPPTINHSGNDTSLCTVFHHVPAQLITLGGFSFNFFHDFIDGLLLMFIATQHLKGEVVFIFVQNHDWWWRQFGAIFKQLSNYEPVILEQGDKNVHCFREVVVGVRVHGYMEIDPRRMPHNESMHDFQKMLERALDKGERGRERERTREPKLSENSLEDCRPQIALMARKVNRRITNLQNLTVLADALGFKVLVLYPTRDTPLEEMWAHMRDSEILLGVHGSALTYHLFMHPESIFIQIIPFGTEWASFNYFANSAAKFGLKYIPYHINVSESSLKYKYPPDDRVFADVDSMRNQGWEVLRSTYFDAQDVTLNLARFERVLSEAKSMIITDRDIRERILMNMRGRPCAPNFWRNLILALP